MKSSLKFAATTVFALTALVGLQVAGANASTFDVSIDCPSCGGAFGAGFPTSVDLTTSSASSPYLVTGVSVGTLEPVGYPASQGGGTDNLLYSPAAFAFDTQGLTFSDPGFNPINLFCSATFSGTSSCWVYSGAFEQATFTVTDVSATPLPAALPLFAGGLGALGLFGWRSKRRVRTA
jgi:hypothetical protein